MRRVAWAVVAVVAAISSVATVIVSALPQPERTVVSALEEEPVVNALVPQLADLSGKSPGESSDSAPPEPAPRIVNVVIVGSDSREGKGNRGYGRFSGQRSDTVLLAQINPYANSTTVLSIPRDLWIPMPACAGGGTQRFNAAFERGGLDCTVRTVKSITGMRIHHAVAIDFGAFKKVVELLGGVSVCVNRRLSDTKSGLALKAGTHLLDPEQALSFARSRYSTEDGSDLARIERQHYLVKRLVAQARSKVTSPSAAWELVRRIEPHATVDHKFDPWNAAYLGLQSAGGKLLLTTLPYSYSSSSPVGTVVLDKERAARALEPLRDPPTREVLPAPTPLPAPTGIPCTD